MFQKTFQVEHEHETGEVRTGASTRAGRVIAKRGDRGASSGVGKGAAGEGGEGEGGADTEADPTQMGCVYARLPGAGKLDPKFIAPGQVGR